MTETRMPECGLPGCPYCPPRPDLEIEPGVVWDEVLDFLARARRESWGRPEFDAKMREETDFSPTAIQVLWELHHAIAAWKGEPDGPA